MSKALSFVRGHVGDVIALVSAIGITAVAAFFDDVREMVAEHTAAALAIMLAAFLVGFACARFAFVLSGWANGRRAVRRLDRAFSDMRARQKSIVRTALDAGCVRKDAFDSDVLALCEIGILHAPNVDGIDTDGVFTIDPSVVLDVRDNRERWLD